MRHPTRWSLLGIVLLAVGALSCESDIVSESDQMVDETVGKRGGSLSVCHVGFDVETEALRIKLLLLPPRAASRHYGRHCDQDICDYNPIELGATGREKRDLNKNGISDGCEVPVAIVKRGTLANPGYEGRTVKSTFFFAGNWRNGVQFYEYDPSNNTGLYTQHPSDARHLGWSESLANREFALDEMVATGVNVVNMSFWGSRGTDNWAYWAPMQTATYAHDELFDMAAGKNILIAPYIESYAATPSSPAFIFRDEFPGTQANPAPVFVRQVKELVRRYLLAPANPAWPDQWAQMYDKSGQKRYMVSVIQVSSNQPGVTHAAFADGFGWAADRVFQDTGVKVGFLLDMLPWDSNAPGAFIPRPPAIGKLFNAEPAVLAIQCFIPEIWTGISSESALASWKRGFSAMWIATGVPFVQDVSPGYDAHIVFPGAPVYGNNAFWRNAQTAMVTDLNNRGVTVNTWNGYTEGFAVVPTVQQGSANTTWVSSLFAME